MKKIVKWLFISFLAFIAFLSFSIYKNTQTALGPVHPIFALIKTITPKDNEQVFIQAIKNKDTQGLKRFRETVASFYQLSGDVIFSGTLDKTSFSSFDYALPLNIYRPQNSDNKDLPVVIYYHGGGFTSGNIELISKVAQSIAEKSQAVVITPSYRLAPEHPFPAAIDDSYNALKWFFQQAEELGFSTNKVFVSGDSAGGNLAATVALQAKQDNLHLAGQILIYPDLAVLSHPFDQSIIEIGIPPSADFITAVGIAYAANSELKDTKHSPIYAKDLSGLAPAMFITADFDPLLTEGQQYAAQLQAAKINVDHHHYPTLSHGFISMVGLLNEADEAIDKIADFIKIQL